MTPRCCDGCAADAKRMRATRTARIVRDWRWNRGGGGEVVVVASEEFSMSKVEGAS